MKKIAENLQKQTWFNNLITAIIVINCVLIGVETYVHSSIIHGIQVSFNYVFLFELIVRFLGRDSFGRFFKDGWNLFDLFIVTLSFVPESMFSSASAVTAIRILRVFRVLRLLKTATEIKIIIEVLIRSLSALTYNALFFFIFMYLYALIGLNTFKLPNPQTASPEVAAKMQELLTIAPPAPSHASDPYGSLDETFFTLFRLMTGDDWSDLRYNLLKANEMGLIHSSHAFITLFHVSWFVLSAFLLLNLVVGAILNNYQTIMEEHRKRKLELSATSDDGLKVK